MAEVRWQAGGNKVAEVVGVDAAPTGMDRDMDLSPDVDMVHMMSMVGMMLKKAERQQGRERIASPTTTMAAIVKKARKRPLCTKGRLRVGVVPEDADAVATGEAMDTNRVIARPESLFAGIPVRTWRLIAETWRKNWLT